MSGIPYYDNSFQIITGTNVYQTKSKKIDGCVRTENRLNSLYSHGFFIKHGGKLHNIHHIHAFIHHAKAQIYPIHGKLPKNIEGICFSKAHF